MNVDLVGYLPPYLAKYEDISQTLSAEEPEFVLLWNAAEQVLKNEFISTADEYGISRFEKLLGIFPSSEDTLESRRSKVQTRWISTTPYTMRAFLQKLIALCGKSNFRVTKYYMEYLVDVEISVTLYGQVLELEKLIDMMFPCNIVIRTRNSNEISAGGNVLVGGSVAQTLNTEIDSELDESNVLDGKIIYAVCLSDHKSMIIDTA